MRAARELFWGKDILRKIATLPVPVRGIVRVMLYASESETFLFLYDTHSDAPCVADEWYEVTVIAEERCRDEFGLSQDDWEILTKPPPGSQSDRTPGVG